VIMLVRSKNKTMADEKFRGLSCEFMVTCHMTTTQIVYFMLRLRGKRPVALFIVHAFMASEETN
jgi:hypothetical protein